MSDKKRFGIFGILLLEFQSTQLTSALCQYVPIRSVETIAGTPFQENR